MLQVRPSTVNKKLLDGFFFLLFSFSWELEAKTDLNSNRTSSMFSHFNFSFLPRLGGSSFSPSGTSKIQSRDSLLILEALCTEGWSSNCVRMEGLGFNILWSFGSFTTLFSVPLSMWNISRGSCCHGTKQDEVSPPVSKLDVYGCIVKNYPFWQLGVVYAELTHHSSSSKVERGSSGHSLCVKTNVSFSSAGRASELAVSFHSLVSCSNEQPLHALPSSWLALEGRSIWSSINVSFRIMRAREEGN